jgi:glycosyltransferase involved in cell wall biosynthesis
MSTTPGSFCVVANELDHLMKSGGIGTANWLLAHLLARYGWRVRILYCGPAPHRAALSRVRRRLAQAAIELSNLDDFPTPPTLRGPSWPTSCVYPCERTRYALEQLLRAHPCDLVEFADWGGLGFRAAQAKRAGLAFVDVGLVVRLHGMNQWVREGNSQCPAGFDDLLRDSCERFAFEEADWQISPSRYMLDVARALGWQVRDDARAVPNPYPEPEFLREPWPHGDPPELVFFGRLEPRKGLEVFLGALRNLDPRLPVTFLGREPQLADRPRAADQIRSRLQGRPFRLLTDLDRGQALAYLAAGNRLAVIPSLVENYAYTVIECAVNGIPFLASRVGGTPEILPDPELQTHLLFEPDPTDLRRRLTEYLEADPGRRDRWRVRAHAAADADGRNGQVLAFYDRCLEELRGGERRGASRPVAPAALSASRRAARRALVTVAVTTYNPGAYLYRLAHRAGAVVERVPWARRLGKALAACGRAARRGVARLKDRTRSA